MFTSRQNRKSRFLLPEIGLIVLGLLGFNTSFLELFFGTSSQSNRTSANHQNYTWQIGQPAQPTQQAPLLALLTPATNQFTTGVQHPSTSPQSGYQIYANSYASGNPYFNSGNPYFNQHYQNYNQTFSDQAWNSLNPNPNAFANVAAGYGNGQYNNGQYNNGQYNNGQYNNGQYNNGQYNGAHYGQNYPPQNYSPQHYQNGNQYPAYAPNSNRVPPIEYNPDYGMQTSYNGYSNNSNYQYPAGASYMSNNQVRYPEHHRLSQSTFYPSPTGNTHTNNWAHQPGATNWSPTNTMNGRSPNTGVLSPLVSNQSNYLTNHLYPNPYEPRLNATQGGWQRNQGAWQNHSPYYPTQAGFPGRY